MLNDNELIFRKATAAATMTQQNIGLWDRNVMQQLRYIYETLLGFEFDIAECTENDRVEGSCQVSTLVMEVDASIGE